MRSRRLRRAFAGLVAIALTLGTFSAASADTRSRLTSARQRLHDLETQIAQQIAAIQGLNASLDAANAEKQASSQKVDQIQKKVLESRHERERIQARYDAIRSQISQVVLNAYMRGPTADIQTLIDPTSIADAADAMSYANAIVAHESELAQEAQHLAFEVRERQKREADVLRERLAALKTLTTAQNAVASRVIEAQNRFAALAGARAQVAKLLAQLQAQLRAEEIAAARAALAGGMEFGKWATALVGHLDDPVARNNLVVLVAWQMAEFTSARWNPLATTYPMPGSTSYNSSGVRNYVSLTQGLEATTQTLSRPGFGYEAILLDLKRNADPMETAQAIRDSSWCGGCASGRYVVDWVPQVESNYDFYARQHA
jgi:peptidoglycan hydrolase CwlO-like protein